MANEDHLARLRQRVMPGINGRVAARVAAAMFGTAAWHVCRCRSDMRRHIKARR
jgi:hypothetical protein